MEFLIDLWGFLKERKKFWLAPIIVVLLLLGILIVIGGGSAISPFIYALFQRKMGSNHFKTIFVINTGLLILFVIFKSPLFIYATIVISLSSLVSGHARNFIVWIWAKLAEILGFINTRIILSFVFFILVVPISFIYRIFHKDPMKISRPNEATLFNTRNHKFTKLDLKNTWQLLPNTFAEG